MNEMTLRNGSFRFLVKSCSGRAENNQEDSQIWAIASVPSRVMRKFVCRLWLNEVSQQ